MGSNKETENRSSFSKSASSTIPYRELVFKKRIGEGGFGEVWLGEWSGQAVAIKNLKLTATSPQLEELKREARVMKRLRNPTIVSFYGLCLENTKCIVIEYMEEGSLNSVLNKKRPQDFTWEKRYVIAKDIVEGLAYLHRQTVPIIHRDLKSHNVLFMDKYRAKLADFGLAYEKIKTETLTKTPLSNQDGAMRGVGTLCWMAPELFFINSNVFSGVRYLCLWSCTMGNGDTPDSLSRSQSKYFAKCDPARSTS